MKVDAGLEMLELSARVMGQPMVIHPSLLWDGDTVILVDAGLPVREAMEKTEVPFNQLSKIIITHHDLDHIGSLAAILRDAPAGVEVLAQEAEVPFIRGERPPLKMTPDRMAQLEKQLNALPEVERQALRSMFANPKDRGAEVNRTLADGERLPYCGGITVIHTPGHTPGHICLYLERSQTLVAGDALTVESGILKRGASAHNFDNDLAIKSLQKLTQLNIQKVICYHGGLYQDEANRRITELAQ